jgi:hypothetical protein
MGHGAFLPPAGRQMLGADVLLPTHAAEKNRMDGAPSIPFQFSGANAESETPLYVLSGVGIAFSLAISLRAPAM